ncbi:MAG: hypothetical protein A2234_11125 [Elusimicrobia bacterium RIFOXYA2_FULL_58_8]|nr:MAG: hypothetical protein A2234_11125 [Elusimicrobia bacterium RIFOXYA2_FULL_58_8]
MPEGLGAAGPFALKHGRRIAYNLYMLNFPKTPLLASLLTAALLGAAAASDMENAAIFPGLPYPVEINLPARGEPGARLYETGFSAPTTWDYDTLLLQGEMPDPAVRIDVEVKSRVFFMPDASYRQTAFRRFPNGRFWAKYKLDLASRQPVNLVVVNLGLKAATKLILYGSELQKAAAMREDAEPRQDVPYVPAASLYLPPDAPFTVVRRAQWQAAPPREPYTQHAPRYFTLHHTQAHYPGTYEEAVAEIQFIQDFHQTGRGWNDIGYHFLIDPLGNIFEGRPLNVVGAHTKGHNTSNVGISMMGSFHPPASHLLTAAAVNSFAPVGTYLKDTYTVNKSSFYAHRDLQKTDCPGDDLYPKMETLRGLIFDPRPLPAITGDPLVAPAQAASLRSLIDSLK